MIITINDTTINATSCYPERYPNGKLVLKFVIPKTEIEHDELFDLIKNNTDDITVSEDGATIQTYSGFAYTLTILTDDTSYTCEVEAIAEADRKIAQLQSALAEEEALIEAQNTSIAALRCSQQNQDNIIIDLLFGSIELPDLEIPELEEEPETEPEA